MAVCIDFLHLTICLLVISFFQEQLDKAVVYLLKAISMAKKTQR